MALHRLTQIVMGVPNVEQTSAYYAEFGLADQTALPLTDAPSETPTSRSVEFVPEALA